MLIKKYTADWVKSFTDLKYEIEKGLSGLEYQIEHIGSTAVPGLDSKAIIDLDIAYGGKTPFEKVKIRLIEIGYYHNGNQGIEQREVFKRAGDLTNSILDATKHHLYVCPTKSKALERHLLSRDYLRKNNWARLEYQSMKYDLAEKANQDKKRYAALKELKVNAFIDLIIEKERRTHNKC
ncbi:MAG: GrpB-like predicted nucleotidyltransferase (UPF0157 family) [Marivirga sp.]|jgi:GrpB-like predicted nucleotidyltransferase (UPF0157 family)